MVLHVIGIRNVDFADKSDATKRVKGVSVFCARPFENSEGEGLYYNVANGKGDKFFFSEWFMTNRMSGVVPRPGDRIDISFTREGKIEKVHILEPVKEK